MPQSSTLYDGLAGQKESMAVAYVAHEHEAAVTYLGPSGTRQCDLGRLLRTLQSKSPHLLCIYGARPTGYRLYRYLRKKGHVCGVVAPSLLPKKATARVNTERRDAAQWARLMRSGDLTPVYVPAVEDAAMRDLSRAREEALSDLKTAQCRRNAFLRHTGRVTGGAAHLRWLSAVVCPTPAPPIVFHEYVWAVTDPSERLQRLA